MVKIFAPVDGVTVCVAGRGIIITQSFELLPGIIIRPNPPRHENQVVADGCETLQEYASVISMMELATFFLEVTESSGGQELAAKAWNSLWLFHLLALSCRRPCESLYCWTGESRIRFSLTTAHIVNRGTIEPGAVTAEQLSWGRDNLERFDSLLGNPKFSAALLSYVNSHQLYGYSARIMQIWSGIESLFDVSSEISRTVAVYSALLLETENPEARYACFKKIKKEYEIRSRVVHGAITNKTSLNDAYTRAGEILAGLLARCVELSRVPLPEELDRIVLSNVLSR